MSVTQDYRGSTFGEETVKPDRQSGGMTEGIQQTMRAEPKREGRMTRAVEKQTAKIPSQFWLACAGCSILGSLAIKLKGHHQTANFVGQWAPTFLVLGLYNKMVKLLGSERAEHVPG